MELINQNSIENRIVLLRGSQVMLDLHFAELYGVETKRLNEQVKRNIERFPLSFMFQLTKQEWDILQSQIATATPKNGLKSQIATIENDKALRSQNETLNDKRGRHSKYLPFAFSEQGVAMLSAVLRSQTTLKVNIHKYKKIEMEHIIQSLTNRIKGKAERYETPLLQLDAELVDVENKVNPHLKKMGFEL